MATLIPALSSCAGRMQPGERRLAQRLEAKLDDDYLLWYDVPVGPQHLHPDFVILHPSRGLFVLEVKDWKLSTIETVNPDEFAISPNGQTKQVKNPLHQARDYALAICSLLEKDPALVQQSKRYQGKLICPYAYGVVLPNAQNLYGQRAKREFSFKSVGIKAQGRTTILKLNYRNTAQVLLLAYEFAKEVMQPTDGTDDDMPPLVAPSSAGRQGPVPELVKCSNFGGEVAHIIQRAQQLQERGIPWNEMAILYRSRWMGERICRDLQQAGLPVDWINQGGDSRNFDPTTQSIKLMTMHASKGLEFPVVFIPGVGFLPNRHGEVADEARLLYVAMTRAIEVLVLSCDLRSGFVEQIEEALEKVE